MIIIINKNKKNIEEYNHIKCKNSSLQMNLFLYMIQSILNKINVNKRQKNNKKNLTSIKNCFIYKKIL